MDLATLGMDGLEATRRITGLGLESKVLVLTIYDEDEFLIPALDAGAAGYVNKSVADTGLMEALEALVRDHTTCRAEGPGHDGPRTGSRGGGRAVGLPLSSAQASEHFSAGWRFRRFCMATAETVCLADLPCYPYRGVKSAYTVNVDPGGVIPGLKLTGSFAVPMEARRHGGLPCGRPGSLPASCGRHERHRLRYADAPRPRPMGQGLELQAPVGGQHELGQPA